jgi:energy-coupling factor transport system permease protein
MFSPHSSTHGARHGTGTFIARDPRFLIAAFASIVVSAFVVRGTWGLFAVFLYLLLLHRLSGLPVGSMVTAARIVGPFFLIVVAVNAVLVRGEPFTSSLPFVSREGVASGLRGGVRVCVLYLAVLVFFGTASAEDIAKGVSSLVRPVSSVLARRVAVYGLISFGFLPLFIDELRRISVAQKFRGAGVDGGLVKKLGAARLLVVPLVVSAIHRSEQLAMSVELRRIRTRVEGILALEKVSARDYLFLVVTLTVLIAAGRMPR